MEILSFLKSNINSNMPLLSIIDVFSRMCQIEINCADEMFLFETGIGSYSSKDKFCFSLVRQFSDSSDEPTQIHLDLKYDITEINRKVSSYSWHESSGDFIQTVLFSKAFEICKNDNINDIDIWIDRT